jgi:alpha-amylase
MYHNYFASRFDDVDRAYGDLASFRHLVKALHSRGMKIYLDEEIQYTAETNPRWAESAGHPESKYSDYILYGGPGEHLPGGLGVRDLCRKVRGRRDGELTGARCAALLR